MTVNDLLGEKMSCLFVNNFPNPVFYLEGWANKYYIINYLTVSTKQLFKLIKHKSSSQKNSI